MRILATIKPLLYEQPNHSFGMVVDIDWNEPRIVRRLRIPTASFGDERAFMAPFVNGMCMIGRNLYVACWNFIVVVNYDTFQIEDCVSHPPMADLHGLSTDGKRLFVASTAIDAVLCLDAGTLDLLWVWGENEPLLTQGQQPQSRKASSLFGRKAVQLPKNSEHRYHHKSTSGLHNHHLNEVNYHDGRLQVVTKGWFDGKSSAVIELDPETGHSHFLASPGTFRGAHDGKTFDGKLYVTESAGNSVAWLDGEGKVERRSVRPDNYFVRGLEKIGDNFLVGFSTMRNHTDPGLIVEFADDFSHEVKRIDFGALYPDGQGVNVHAIMAVKD